MPVEMDRILWTREPEVHDETLTLFASEKRMHMEVVDPETGKVAGTSSGATTEGFEEAFNMLAGYSNIGASGWPLRFYQAYIAHLQDGTEVMVVGESLGDHTDGGFQRSKEWLEE